MPSLEPGATLGVIGAGSIGRGVAHDLARHGHHVVLVDVDQERLDAARAAIRRDMRGFSLIGGGGPVGPADAMALIEPTTDYGRLRDAAFVIENVTEDRAVKRSVYEILDDTCGKETVFAANTSAVTITSIGSFTRRPDRVLGIHFMNPVPLKPTVEMIRGFHTSPRTIEVAEQLLAAMGKRGILVEDAPGFVSNRVLMLAVNEAAYLVHERVARPEDIDAIFTDCFGHAMGMLATADLIGIDTVLLSIEMLWEQFGDSKYRPCPLLRTMVDAGLLGRKSGRGFFTYDLPA